MTNYEKLCNYVDSIKLINSNLSEYFKEGDFNESTDVNDIMNTLNENGAFWQPFDDDKAAMEYLMQHDITLQKSYGIWNGNYSWHMDFNARNLASVLRGAANAELFTDYANDIQAFIDALEW